MADILKNEITDIFFFDKKYINIKNKKDKVDNKSYRFNLMMC